MINEIRYAVNRTVINKTQAFERLNSGFVECTGSIESIKKELKSGFAICAGVTKGRRNKSNFVGSQWILLDIDNSERIGEEKIQVNQMTIDQALDNKFIQDNCTFIYTTASHTESWHRFRLVFVLDEWIEDLELYESIIEELMKIIPHDPVCKDGVRVFYGNTEAQFWDIGKTLNSSIVAIAKLNYQVGRSKVDNDSHWREKYRSDKNKFIESVRDALKYIPKRETGKDEKNYSICQRVFAGVHWLFAGEGDDEIGKELIREWSPEGKEAGDKWDVEVKWRSFKFDKNTLCTIGTVFKIAGEYGWQNKEIEENHVQIIREKIDNGESRSAINAYILKHKLNGTAYAELIELLGDDNYQYAWEEIKKTYVHDIDLADFLNADVLKEYQVMTEGGWGLSNACVLMMLLCGLSALFPTPTRVHIKRGNYSVTPNLYCVHIAPSGAKKSAILDNLVSAGFSGIQRSLNVQYQYKLSEWEREDRKTRGVKPTAPKKIFNSSKSTIEGISSMIQEYPDLSQIAVFEELNAFLENESYSKAKGTFRDFIKKAYDGKGLIQVTNSNPLAVEDYQLSLATVVQPSVWFPYYNLEKDGDGMLNRFLITEQSEIKEVRVEEEDGEDRLKFTTQLIYDTAVRLLNGGGTVHFPTETRKVFAEYYYEISDRIENEADDYIKQMLGKAQGHIAKLAINVHLLSEVMKAIEIGQRSIFIPGVSVEAVRRAYKLWEYSFGCMKRVYYKASSDSAGMDLHSKILKLVDQGKNSKREWTQRFCGKTNKTTPRDIDRALTYLLNEGVLVEVKEGRKTRYNRS